MSQRWQPATMPVERAPLKYQRRSIELTPRKRAILRYLADHSPATIREIGQAVGLKSSSTTFEQMRMLQRAGLIRKERARGRTIRLAPGVFVSVKGDIYTMVRWPDDYTGETL